MVTLLESWRLPSVGRARLMVSAGSRGQELRCPAAPAVSSCPSRGQRTAEGAADTRWVDVAAAALGPG